MKWIISPTSLYQTTHTLPSNLKKNNLLLLTNTASLSCTTPLRFAGHGHPRQAPHPVLHHHLLLLVPLAPPPPDRHAPQSATRRLAVAVSTALVATASLSARRPAAPPPAMAVEAAAVPTPISPGFVSRWGTRSYVRERFFKPGLTTEEAAARSRQTAEGMWTLRPMLGTMSWKYVLFYVRLKSKYLDLDLTTAMAGVPEARRSDYVRVANELVDNMTEFDRFVRTPKVYEKPLKSLDNVAEFLA